jgi:hypothetical protein
MTVMMTATNDKGTATITTTKPTKTMTTTQHEQHSKSFFILILKSSSFFILIVGRMRTQSVPQEQVARQKLMQDFVSL